MSNISFEVVLNNSDADGRIQELYKNFCKAREELIEGLESQDLKTVIKTQKKTIDLDIDSPLF